MFICRISSKIIATNVELIKFSVYLRAQTFSQYYFHEEKSPPLVAARIADSHVLFVQRR
jgi:hypothetical protein